MSTFDTPEPISAVIELAMADVRIVATDRADTTVEVRPSDSSRRADVQAAEQTRVEYAAGSLLVKATGRWRSWSPFGYGGSVDVEVGLPVGSRLTGAAVGAFRCAGALGDCEIKTSVGEIRVERAAAVRLATSAGDITVERATGDAHLTSGSGEIRVGEIAGAAEIKNSNGDTRVGEITGELRVKAANGDIAIDDAHASVTAKTANGDIRVGAPASGSVVAETSYGAVEIGVPDGTAAWLDLHTHCGQLHNALAAGDPPEPGKDRVEVRARTSYGDITINKRER
jgi:putative adhesin